MKLNERYFYCFGCRTTGDVIDLVAKLFGLSSYEAADFQKFKFTESDRIRKTGRRSSGTTISL
jgi:DNA primase